MKLKAEDTSKPFNFLEAIINIENETKITINYNNKNYIPLKETGKLKLLTLQHRHSFITPQQAKAKIVGQLHRVQKTVDTNKSLVQATLEFSPIALHLKYSLREITNAIMHIAIKTNKNICYDIHQFYKTLKSEVKEFV